MEREIMIKIICYAGGTCGDLITALFDGQGTHFRNKAVVLKPDRERLKKPHTFATDNDKDTYLKDIALKYQSVPSHDLQYHVERKHNFIGITVQDQEVALWAAQRFKDLHRPHVWAEMSAACGADTVEDYAQMMIDFSNLVAQHTNNIITLESIRDGTVLTNSILANSSTNLYKNWLDLQKNMFMA